jgi:5S rRNA maturation endonuclease (ribonuclease M5)
MRAPVEVRFEKLQRLIDRISYESQLGVAIIVEGIRDKYSLRKMGVTGPILCLQSSRKSAIQFVEELDGVNDVIVLTDFDREGVFLANRLTRLLTARGIRGNLVLWRDLLHLARGDIRSVEELPKYYQRLQVRNISGFPARHLQSSRVRNQWPRKE